MQLARDKLGLTRDLEAAQRKISKLEAELSQLKEAATSVEKTPSPVKSLEVPSTEPSEIDPVAAAVMVQKVVRRWSSRQG